MAKGLTVQTDGFEHIQKLLRQLPPILQKGALRKGIRAGAKIIAEEARRRVPVDTGALRKSIKVRAATRLRKKTAVGVRVVAGEGDYKGDTFYGSFIEYGYWKQETYRLGSRIYSMKRGKGKSTWVPPDPFMRGALESKAKNAVIVCAWAVRALVEDLARGINLDGSSFVKPYEQ